MIHENNKYYTPEFLIKHIIDVIKENIKDDIEEIIEPSAGDGRFLHYLKQLSDNVLMYDIETDSDIVTKQDFLELDISYKKGRIIVGNPPFGSRGNLYKKFIIKASQICDYIIFILPSTQFNRNYYFKNKCSLIYSELLGDINYNTITCDINVKTCLNIYDCNKNDLQKYNFDFMNDDITILIFNSKCRFDSILKFDFYINSWGYNQGKLFYNSKEYSHSCGIILKNEKNKKELKIFFEKFKENYDKEIKNTSKRGKDSIVIKTYIQEKLKKDFYKL